MKNRILYIVCAIYIVAFSSSCEDPIEVELAAGETALVVDAWIDDQAREQVITLSLSQQYFDSTNPPGVDDAEVLFIKGDGSTIEFLNRGDGKYVYDATSETLGVTGDEVELSIAYDGGNYSASTTINRVPPIDSIGVELREGELFGGDGLYAQFFSRDPVGRGDSYWIKTFVNDNFLSKSQELNLAFDAGFDSGSGVDGIIFIPPIRELTNRLDEDLLQVPYEEGDEVLVEIHAISNEAFRFLEAARDQINNGDNGLFAIPVANTRTNIDTDATIPVLGFFNVAGVSSKSRVIGE